MVSDTESTLMEEQESMWEVGPTRDIVLALIEYLVDPRLPYVHNEIPSDDAHASVARQMRAVVWLYNYYHRKQKLELEFLDFVSFCKLAVVLRPIMIKFMKMLIENKSMEWKGDENQLSVTEKAIKDACDIATALDASADVPNIEGWPISKIAVLLTDSNKENCLLQFGGITEGIWSLLEKEITDSMVNLELTGEKKTIKKRKRKSTKESTDFQEFLQIAFDLVKDIRGIPSSDLEVLKTHVTYSLTKEKSACQFFIMKCPQPFAKNETIPLRDLIESLQGPLALKDGDDWSPTPVVDYSHMLPYASSISNWFLGINFQGHLMVLSMDINKSHLQQDLNITSKWKDLGLPSLRSGNPQRVCEKELTQSSNVVPPAIKYNSKDLDHSVENIRKGENDSRDKKADEFSNRNNNQCKLTSDDEVGSRVKILRIAINNETVLENPSPRCDTLDSATKYPCNLQNSDKDCKECGQESISDPVGESSQRTVKDNCPAEKVSRISDIEDSVSKGTNNDKLNTDCEGSSEILQSDALPMALLQEKIELRFDIRESFKKGSCENLPVILDDENIDLSRKSLVSSKTSVENEGPSEKSNANIKVDHHKRKNLPSPQIDPLKPYDDTQVRDEKATADKGTITTSSHQTAIATTMDQLELLHSNEYPLEENIVPASEDLQNALALLYRKREELFGHICSTGDMLALYEANIERIRDGGDIGLARQCIKYIINGKDHLLFKNQNKIQEKDLQPDEDNAKSQLEKQIRLSATFIPGKSSCQDLEYMCFKNNWRLPRYFVRAAADGKFVSDVMVEGKDLKISLKGDLEANPYEARESAAAQMIASIRDACA